jgi:hypothetical protein
MIRTVTRRALLIAAGCLLLTGCGPAKASPVAAGPRATPIAAAAASAEAATPATGGGGLTACGLITEQEVSTAIGTPTGPGTPGGSAALSECIYDEGTLIVSMKTDAKALFDTSFAAATAKGAANLPGIGDKAFAASIDDGHCLLQLLKGTTLVSIMYGGHDAKNTSIAIAKVAAGKL